MKKYRWNKERFAINISILYNRKHKKNACASKNRKGRKQKWNLLRENVGYF